MRQSEEKNKRITLCACRTDLNRFEDGTKVTPTLLVEAGLVKRNTNGGIKILGNGKLEHQLTVSANKFSKSAEEAIKAAGGTVEVL